MVKKTSNITTAWVSIGIFLAGHAGSSLWMFAQMYFGQQELTRRVEMVEATQKIREGNLYRITALEAETRELREQLKELRVTLRRYDRDHRWSDS